MNISNELLSNKYVAFLDVLGFKEIVKKKDEKLNSYFSTIKKAIDDINNTKQTIKSQLVSDSIILSCDLNLHDLKLLIKAVQTIQVRCACSSIWIRGAISIGDIYFNNNLGIVVGNGLVNAYMLEAQEKFPRVIIDPKIIKENFLSRNEMINELNIVHWENNYYREIPLIHDIRVKSNYIENDVLFVAFGERLFVENPENIILIFENIKQEIYNSQTTFAKYLWLKNYFSHVLDSITDPSYHSKMNDTDKMLINELNARYLGFFCDL